MFNNECYTFFFNIWFNIKINTFNFDDICYIYLDKNRSENRGKAVVLKEIKCD